MAKRNGPFPDQIGEMIETFLPGQDYLGVECEKNSVSVCLFEFKYPEQGKGFRGAGVHMFLFFCFFYLLRASQSCPVFSFDSPFRYENPISFYHHSMRPLERAKQLFSSCGQRD